MSWSAIIALLLEFFGPLLREWLSDRLGPAVPEWRPADDAGLAVEELFDRALARTWRVQVARRAALRACRRIALAHRTEFDAALRGLGACPRPTAAEWYELEAL